MEPYARMVVWHGVDEVGRNFGEQKMQPPRDAVDAGAVARGGTAAAQCATCHGPDGRGNAALQSPSLAGQPSGFLREQMLLFKQDKRNPGDAALKAAKALMLTIPDETFTDLAAYYSTLPQRAPWRAASYRPAPAPWPSSSP